VKASHLIDGQILPRSDKVRGEIRLGGTKFFQKSKGAQYYGGAQPFFHAGGGLQASALDSILDNPKQTRRFNF